MHIYIYASVIIYNSGHLVRHWGLLALVVPYHNETVSRSGGEQPTVVRELNEPDFFRVPLEHLQRPEQKE